MGSAYQFHSWRVFVLVCAFPSVAAISALTTMPESPRFYLEVSRCPVITRLTPWMNENGLDSRSDSRLFCIVATDVDDLPACIA